MERYCSTGQSPQRAVAPTEEKGEPIQSYTNSDVQSGFKPQPAKRHCRSVTIYWLLVSHSAPPSLMKYSTWKHYCAVFFTVNITCERRAFRLVTLSFTRLNSDENFRGKSHVSALSWHEAFISCCSIALLPKLGGSHISSGQFRICAYSWNSVSV